MELTHSHTLHAARIVARNCFQRESNGGQNRRCAGTTVVSSMRIIELFRNLKWFTGIPDTRFACYLRSVMGNSSCEFSLVWSLQELCKIYAFGR